MAENQKKTRKNADKMPWGRFFAWKTRDIALSVITFIIQSYLLLYCTNQLGLDSGIIGVLILAARIVDAFTDLAGGFLVDRTNTKLGKARPYEICILLAWICMIALFCTNAAWSTPLKYVYVFIMYLLIYSVFATMLNACQTPYMVRAFNGRRSIINKVASYGGMVTMGFSIVVALIFPKLYNSWIVIGNGGAAAWRNLILLFGIPMMIVGIIRFLTVREDSSIDADQAGKKLELREALQMLRTNPYVWSLGGMVGLYQLAIGFGAGSFFFQYVVGDAGKFSYVSAISILLLPLMIAFPMLIKKIGISKLFMLCAAISTVGYGVVFLAGSSLPVVFAGVVFSVIVSLCCSYLQAPCVLNVATYNEYKGMHRMEGTSGVIMNFMYKALNGIGTGLTGILLSVSGFISSTGTEVVKQPGSAIMMIRMLYSILPALCTLGIIFCALHFSKLEKQLPQIEAEIKLHKESKSTVE